MKQRVTKESNAPVLRLKTLRGFFVTPHARTQASRRGFSLRDADFILGHGKFRRDDRTDRGVFFMPESYSSVLGGDRRFVQLQGVAVVLSPDGSTIVTIYGRDERFRFGGTDGVL